MKKLLAFGILLVAITAIAQTPAHTQHFQNTKNGMVLYGAMGRIPAYLQATVGSWIGDHFDLAIGGGDDINVHGSDPTKTYNTAYVDIAFMYNYELYQLIDVAVVNGYDVESMFVHTSVDMTYTYPNGVPFTNVRMFDWGEATYGGSYVDGVFLESSGTFTDVTNNTFFSSPSTIASTVYMGYAMPFDQANFTITTARVGGSVAYQYWNGSAWTALSVTDGTSGLTTSGKVAFTPPASWARHKITVNVASPKPITDTNNKFWIRAVVTGASTSPIFTALYQEDWTDASSTNNERGWDSTSGTIINAGLETEYNPTPPAGATAKFEYQSRVTSNAQNSMYGNPIYQPGGAHPWGDTMSARVRTQVEDTSPLTEFDGSFWDDLGQVPPAAASPANSQMYYDADVSSGVWLPAVQFQSVGAETDLHALYGANFYVGANGWLPISPIGTSPTLQYSLQEAEWAAPTTWRPSYTYAVNLDYANTPYDWMAPGSTNTGNSTGWFQYNDQWQFVSNAAWDQFSGRGYTYWHSKDGGDRSPMMTLAMHYMGINANTGFMYNGTDSTYGFGYFGTDQVYTYDTGTTITGTLSTDTTSAQKTITLASAVSCHDGYILKVGGKNDGGDVLRGQLGYVSFFGNDYTTIIRQGGLHLQLVQSPNNIVYFGYQDQFTSLVFDPWQAAVMASATWEYWNGSAWTALSVTDTSSNFTVAGTQTWSAPGDWATGTDGTVSGLYYVRMTSSGAIYPNRWYSNNWVKYKTTSFVYNTWAGGTAAYCVQLKHWSLLSDAPLSADTFAVAKWFPAIGVDIGQPTGARQVPWLTGGSPDNISGQASCPLSTSCADVWRRDFDNGIVLYRPYVIQTQGGYVAMIESELETYSHDISLGGTYYLLHSDGRTDVSPITSITLRGGEGAILMNSSTPGTTGGTVRGGRSVSGGKQTTN